MLKVGHDVLIHGRISYIGDDHVIVQTSDKNWIKVDDVDSIELPHEAASAPVEDEPAAPTPPATTNKVVNASAGDSTEAATE